MNLQMKNFTTEIQRIQRTMKLYSNSSTFSFFFFLFSFSFLLSPSFSQDIHFSQFYASPLTLNPANTGNYAGDWRFANIFRRQWPTIVKKKPFQTIAASYDQQFYVFNENISGGFVIISDKSGFYNLSVSKLYLSGAYHKTIRGNNLHFGFQGGYVNKGFNNDGISYPEQWDMSQGQFNPELTYSGLTPEKKSYVDLNTGAIWGKKFGKFEPEVGFALYHVNYPKESLIDNDPGRLPMRQVFHYGGKIHLTSKLFLLPNLLIMTHKKAKDFLEGANLAYRLPKNPVKIQYVYGGLLFRNGIKRNNDAGIAIIGAQFRRMNVGLSYDVNISDLKAATNNRGGFEVSLIYIGPSTLLQNISIPCDRD